VLASTSTAVENRLGGKTMKRTTTRTMILVLLALAALGALSVGCEEKKVGAPCETYRSEECGGPGGACLAVTGAANYCSHTCTAAKDCPGGFKCKDITASTYDGKGQKTSDKQVKMCVR
jgi:hypothetical protein